MNHPARTDQEWLELITTCRTSGLNDKDWCEQNAIPISTFYNAIRRLRKRACEIPAPSGHKSIIDLTASPDVVKVDIVDEGGELSLPAPIRHLDNPYTIPLPQVSAGYATHDRSEQRYRTRKVVSVESGPESNHQGDRAKQHHVIRHSL